MQSTCHLLQRSENVKFSGISLALRKNTQNPNGKHSQFDCTGVGRTTSPKTQRRQFSSLRVGQDLCGKMVRMRRRNQFSLKYLLLIVMLAAVHLQVMGIGYRGIYDSQDNGELSMFWKRSIIYFPIILISNLIARWWSTKKIGKKLTTVFLPLWKTPDIYGVGSFLMIAVFFILFGWNDFALFISGLGLMMMLLQCFSPVAIIGSQGIAHRSTGFLPWSEWRLTSGTAGFEEMKRADCPLFLETRTRVSFVRYRMPVDPDEVEIGAIRQFVHKEHSGGSNSSDISA